MKKKLSLVVRAVFSFVHIAFVKIFNMRRLNASFVQDLAWSAKVFPHDGGRIFLGRHIHARRNTVFEAEGGTLEIGEGCFFNSGCMMVSMDSIKIGSYTCFGPNVLVYDHDHRIDTDENIHDSGYKTDAVTIGSNVWIGANSVILRGTYIGDGCVIGAGSVIKGNYEPYSVVVQKRADTVVTRRHGKEVQELVR